MSTIPTVESKALRDIASHLVGILRDEMTPAELDIVEVLQELNIVKWAKDDDELEYARP